MTVSEENTEIEEDRYSEWSKLLKSSLQIAIDECDGISWSAMKIKESVCTIGFDGTDCGLRIPASDSETSNWSHHTNHLKTRVVSAEGSSYLFVGFDFTNFDDLSTFLVDLIFMIDELDDDPMDIVLELISNKKYGWESPPMDISLNDVRGMIGELLVFEKIMQNAGVTQALDSWKAPNMRDNDDEDDHDLHDFQGSDGHLEAKTSASLPGSIFIDNLDQMDHTIIQPLALGIVYVQLTKDGSEFSLSSLADRIFEACAESGHSAQFRDQLQQRGYRIGDDEGWKADLYNLVSLNIHWVNDSTEIYTRRHLTRNFAAVVELTQVVSPNTLGLDELNEGDWEAVLSRIGLV